MSVIKKEKGIVIALDVKDVHSALALAREFSTLQGNFAIKVGRPLEMQAGYKIIPAIKEASQLPVIYDGKIADIPYISSSIARIAYEAGADAVIVHGFVGKDVIKSILDLNMGDVIVVISMSHQGSAQYIDLVAKNMADMVNALEVNGVVLPATKPKLTSSLASILKEEVYILSPGIKAQGADVGDAIKAGADYEIIGRAIYNSLNPKQKAEEFYKKVREV